MPRCAPAALEVFREEIAALVPEAETSHLMSWDDVKLLDVKLNRLTRWHADGLLCIGDAAHAMSPMGGVGINLAVQDAVGAATLLAEPLRRRGVTDADLAAVRRRRLPATVVTQAIQRAMHRALVVPVFGGADGKPPAAFVTLLRKLPWVTAIPARVIGVGVRPERARVGPALVEFGCQPSLVDLLGADGGQWRFADDPSVGTAK